MGAAHLGHDTVSIWCGTRVISNLVGLSALTHPLFIRSREGPQPSMVAFLLGKSRARAVLAEVSSTRAWVGPTDEH